MTRHLIRTATLFLLAIAFLSACGRDLGTAQGVVEEFVDQHYVRIDLQKAKEYAVGLALEKINDEIRLTSGQVIDASTRKPRIHYRLLEKKEGERRASFLYEGTIEAEDAPAFTRRWLVAVRKEENQWRVSNFTEYD
jgi:outer membrane lipopolysaccharide assembly protein LptE/RlpB